MGLLATAALNALIPIFLLLMIFFRFIRPNQRSENPNKIRLTIGYVLMIIWAAFAVIAIQRLFDALF